ncbi:MAG: MBL fold metallo-hydrolase [Lactimicrobium sp.]|jgi:L-ascorbate metabolism protein UlaG (beta-lactamase superfamily)|uniref:MBL fold metallo-hydrolase n=1 Tax=Lactimicrobium sp. TaxID=2563780 RepID=UPI002F356F85
MSEISIQYLGHSCFKVSYQQDSIVLDPYADESVPGLKLPAVTAGQVHCSHQHSDHNASDLVQIVQCTRKITYEGIMVPHDDADGAKRGMCEAIRMHAGECTIAHVGDLGRLLTEKEKAFLQGSDVLMIPCGGYFTIDAAQARQVMNQIHPKLTILMHFRRGSMGYPVTADFDAVKAIFPEAEDREESTVTFDEDHVPEGVLILKPKQ